MKSMMNFIKTMLIMPIQWQIWLGVLVTANIVVPIFFIHTLEAQAVMVTAVAGLLIMSVIFSEKGFAYCQLKPDLADWTCEAHSVIPDNSMESLQANGVRRVGNFVKLPIPRTTLSGHRCHDG